MSVIKFSSVFFWCSLILFVSPVSAQMPNTAPLPSRDPLERFVSLRADGSKGHHLAVSVPTGLSSAFAQATVVLDQNVWQVDENSCEGFKAAVFQFRELPPIRIGDQYLQTASRSPQPIAPSRKDGEIWLIRARAYTPDGSSIDIEMNGGQGPYAGWISNVVETVKTCGGLQP